MYDTAMLSKWWRGLVAHAAERRSVELPPSSAVMQRPPCFESYMSWKRWRHTTETKKSRTKSTTSIEYTTISDLIIFDISERKKWMLLASWKKRIWTTENGQRGAGSGQWGGSAGG